jgi:hypothetical protein
MSEHRYAGIRKPEEAYSKRQVLEEKIRVAQVRTTMRSPWNLCGIQKSDGFVRSHRSGSQLSPGRGHRSPESRQINGKPGFRLSPE